MGKQVYHAKADAFDGDVESIRKLSPCFVDVKIDTRNSEALIKFQKAGFYLTDTNVQFIKKIENSSFHETPQVRPAMERDSSSVRRIASEVFLSNRFHRDPFISHSISAKIKEEWVGNFFSGKRGDAMLIAEIDGVVAGFILLLEQKEKKETLIDLIGIDTPFQGKGLAKQLIEASGRVFQSNQIRVGTQLSNPSSIFLYQRLGFTFDSSNYSLHLHL